MAEFLTDYMRARVRVATFASARTRGYPRATVAKIGYRWCCPLAVALSIPGAAYPEQVWSRILTTSENPVTILDRWHVFIPIARDFMWKADMGEIGPHDVKAALGCEP